MRKAFVHDSLVAFAAGADRRAPGGAVAVGLCGHWDHEGPCRWPSLTSVGTDETGRTHVRVVFACEPTEEPEVRQRIARALESGTIQGPEGERTWTFVAHVPSVLEASEEGIALRLCQVP